MKTHTTYAEDWAGCFTKIDLIGETTVVLPNGTEKTVKLYTCCAHRNARHRAAYYATAEGQGRFGFLREEALRALAVTCQWS